MQLVARVVADGDLRPPAGTPVRVELRDVTDLDAPSVLLAAADGRVEDLAPGGVLARLTLDVDEPLPAGRDVVLWARVAASDALRSSPGDWVTVQSVPVSGAERDALTVPVRRIV